MYDKTQGFRVELQVSGWGGVTGKGQDRGKTRDEKSQGVKGPEGKGRGGSLEGT